MIDPQQSIGTAALVAAVIVPVLMKISHDRKLQHIENQKKLDEILKEKEYLIPHDHIENDDDEPLLASGIIRKRKRNGP